MSMSRSTNEELGRRMFRLNMQKAVEESLEKIRRNEVSELDSFSAENITRIRNILGEVWVIIGRNVWDTITFSRITRSDLDDILMIYRDNEGKKGTQDDMIKDVAEILKNPGRKKEEEPDQ